MATLALLLLVSVFFKTLAAVGGNKVGSWSVVVLHTELGGIVNEGPSGEGSWWMSGEIGVSIKFSFLINILFLSILFYLPAVSMTTSMPVYLISNVFKKKEKRDDFKPYLPWISTDLTSFLPLT